MRSRRVGVATFFRMMHEHGSAEAALDALPGVAAAAGVSDYKVCPMGVVQAELKAGRLAGASLIAFGSPEYPKALYDLTDPPPLLWAIGDLSLLERPGIAMVGARNASSLGTRMARRMADELGQAGNVIVSGLARGIDTAAHLAALPHGTVAVMAGGVDVIYPAENAVLAQEIGERGLRLSEQPMGLQPQARHFPRRNRIVSGTVRGVVVVEAAARSGSLITARDALDQGREVMAVPGHPFDARASGCNMLIRDGATLVRGADDVLAALGSEPVPPDVRDATPAKPRLATTTPKPKKPASTLREANALHQLILDRLGPSPLAEDQLIRDLALSPGEVAPQLVSLELDGRIARQPGGLLTKL
nr:DNA-processing protein DprA [Oceaniglobus trochenteri]